MKIALVQTPCWAIMCPPYGLSVLSAYLREKGHQVFVKDLNIRFRRERTEQYADAWNHEEHLLWINERLVSNFIFDNQESVGASIEDILSTGAMIIGFSIHYTSEHMAKELAKRIKQKDKERIIVFGGPQASRARSGLQLAELDYVDFVVQGEGEVTLEEIVRKVEGGERIDFCPGAILKRDGRVVDCGDRPLIADLNALPFADFDDYNFNDYLEPSRLPISFSRGCPNRCIFCNEKPYWRSFRIRKAENIYAELLYQIKKMGSPGHLDFQDSLINGNTRELEKFCELVIAGGLKFRWSGQVAISKEMTPNLLSKMKKAGCVSLNYGLETGSCRLMQEIGKFISKGADIDQIIRATHTAGIDCIVNFMFGFPGETEEDFRQSLDFLERNKDYIDMVNPSPGFCAFEKGSYGFEHADEFGIVPGENGALWESRDDKNDYAARLEKFEKFLQKTHELGIKNYYPHLKLSCRNAVLGHFYFTKKQWSKAIPYLEGAIKEQAKDEASLLYLAKSLFALEEKGKAGFYFKEVADIRTAKGDTEGTSDIIKECNKMGLSM